MAFGKQYHPSKKKKKKFQASNSFALGLPKSDFRALVPATLLGGLGQVGLLTPQKLPALEERAAGSEATDYCWGPKGLPSRYSPPSHRLQRYWGYLESS